MADKNKERGKLNFQSLKDLAAKGAEAIDIDALKDTAQKASQVIGTKAADVKDSAAAMKDDLTDKLYNMDNEAAKKAAKAVGDKATEIKDSAMAMKDEIADKIGELDRMLEESISEYNAAYTTMNDYGVQLFVERSRAVDSISFVENLVNSIANHPKSFDSDFEEIRMNRQEFLNTCDFGQKELEAAKAAAGGAGAGLAAGASAAFMAPTAAMWVATTFGTASTGTAISALSGVAAQNAALAWLGGGALSAGGGGMAAGNALLAMAGPIGWSIAGATLLTSILLFANKKTKLNKQKNEEIDSVKRNTESVKEMGEQVHSIQTETMAMRAGLNEAYSKCLNLFGKDYSSFTNEQKNSLGAVVNNTRALSAMFKKTVEAQVVEDDGRTEEISDQ